MTTAIDSGGLVDSLLGQAGIASDPTFTPSLGLSGGRAAPVAPPVALSGKTIKMVDRFGQVGDVPEEQAAMAEAQGYTRDTPQASAVREYVKENKGLSGAAKVALAQFGDEALFGIPEIIHEKTNDPLEVAKWEALKKEHYAANTIGGLGGFGASLVVGGPLWKGAAAAGRAAETGILGERLIAAGAEQAVAHSVAKKALAGAARMGVEGGVVAAPVAVTEAMLGDPDEAAETMLYSMGAGAALGGVSPVAKDLFGRAFKGAVLAPGEKLVDKLDSYANEQAIKSLDPYKRISDRLAETIGGKNGAGAIIREKGLTRQVGEDFESVLERVEAARKQTGDQIGAVYQQLDDAGVTFDARDVAREMRKDILGPLGKRVGWDAKESKIARYIESFEEKTIKDIDPVRLLPEPEMPSIKEELPKPFKERDWAKLEPKEPTLPKEPDYEASARKMVGPEPKDPRPALMKKVEGEYPRPTFDEASVRAELRKDYPRADDRFLEQAVQEKRVTFEVRHAQWEATAKRAVEASHRAELTSYEEALKRWKDDVGAAVELQREQYAKKTEKVIADYVAKADAVKAQRAAHESERAAWEASVGAAKEKSAQAASAAEAEYKAKVQEVAAENAKRLETHKRLASDANSLKPTDLVTIRQDLDRLIYGEKMPSPDQVDQELKGIRGLYKGKLDSAVQEHLGVEARQELAKLNNEFNVMSTVKKGAEKNIGREMTNRTNSLTDYLMGITGSNIGNAVGGLIGGPVGGIVGGGVSTLLGMFGNKYLRANFNTAAVKGAEKLGILLGEQSMRKVALEFDRIPAIFKGMASGEVSKAEPVRAMAEMLGVHAPEHAGAATKLEQFEKLSAKISEAVANGVGTTNELGKLAGAMAQGGAPTIGAKLAEKQMAALQYLYETMPKAPPPQPFSPKVKWTPSPQQLADWEARIEVVMDPTSVLKHLKQGTVTRAHRESLERVYPALYERMQKRFDDLAAQPDGPVLNYRHRAALRALQGLPSEAKKAPPAPKEQQTSMKPPSGRTMAGAQPTKIQQIAG